MVAVNGFDRENQYGEATIHVELLKNYSSCINPSTYEVISYLFRFAGSFNGQEIELAAFLEKNDQKSFHIFSFENGFSPKSKDQNNDLFQYCENLVKNHKGEV